MANFYFSLGGKAREEFAFERELLSESFNSDSACLSVYRNPIDINSSRIFYRYHPADANSLLCFNAIL
jgi:hypothetical protein